MAAPPPPSSSPSPSPSSCSVGLGVGSRLGKSLNSRNSETSNPMRKSFSGNPFARPSPVLPAQRYGDVRGSSGFNPNTPANSPSDTPQRNSINRESILLAFRQYEDKENRKDQNQKPLRVRTPGANAKGTKNFMSPTISAASKINSSPRKKILVDRTEQLPSSVSSVGKISLVEDLESKPENGGLSQKKEVSFDSTVTFIGDTGAAGSDLLHSPTNVSSSSDSKVQSYVQETSTLDKDCVNLDPSFEISPRVPCLTPSLALAPLDADPLIPPYDPKTSYLSPRPQFLHYRPNLRTEMYLEKERDGNRLEDNFASDGSSDTEVTEEEETQSDDLPKESNDASSDDVEKGIGGKEQERAEEELLVSESNSIGTAKVESESRLVSKPFFSTRIKLFAFLMVLTVACLWVPVSRSPIMDPAVLNNLSFPELYVPPQISEFTKNIIEVLLQKSQLCLSQSLSYMKDLFCCFRERHKLGSFQYANLTIVSDGMVEADVFDHYTLGAEVKNENNVLGPGREGEVDIETREQEKDGETETDDGIDEQEGMVENECYEVSNEDSAPESVETIVTPSAELISAGISEVELKSNNIDHKDQPIAIPQAAEIQPEVLNARLPQVEYEMSSTEFSTQNVPESLDSDAAIINLGLPEATSRPNASMGMIFIAGSCAAVAGVLATVVFIYINNRKQASNAATPVQQVPLTKKPDYGPMLVTTETTFHETEVDMVGEWGPSELSGFQYSGSSSYSEAQSQEKKPSRKSQRRESLASSDYSMGSPSYGSFTTYEKIPVKHGDGEEEMITPVRRSSRIRNQGNGEKRR